MSVVLMSHVNIGISMPPQPMLQRRHYVSALSVAGFVRPVFRRKNAERISMKFAGGNHCHEWIK